VEVQILGQAVHALIDRLMCDDQALYRLYFDFETATLVCSHLFLAVLSITETGCSEVRDEAFQSCTPYSQV
jgi:hypothetical protein